MKILFISECYPDKDNPQYCIYLEQQAKAIVNKGHEVDILVPKLCDGKSGVAKTVYNGLNIFNVTINRGEFSRIFPLYSLKNTLKKFAWQDYDVVSSHIVSNGLCFRISNICRKYKVPIVKHFHGLNVWKDYYTKNNLVHRALWLYNDIIKMYHLKSSSAIVGVSNKVCDIAKTRLKGKQIFTVYNGVDSERFSVKKEKNNQFFTILCVANLIKIKGHEYLLDAVARLKKEDIAVKLKLIGVGPEEKLLKEKCSALSLDDIVEFLGTKNYQEVAEYMKNADMFIMPSYFEALGCVYLESMCSGTLTCGCHGTGADEIIEDKIDGLLVDQRSADSIYNAIIFALNNPEKKQEIVQKGIQKAKSFSWAASAESLINVYESIINKG